MSVSDAFYFSSLGIPYAAIELSLKISVSEARSIETTKILTDKEDIPYLEDLQ